MGFIRQRKGFTMIELVVVIAIMGIVFTSISSFLISNLKTFNRAEDQIEAQDSAQTAINQIVQNVMEAEDVDIDYYSATKTPTSMKFTFSIGGNISYIKYDYDRDSHILSKGKGNNEENISTRKYAENIKTFEVTEIVNDGVTKGIELTVTTELNYSEVELKNQVYFRNAGN